MSGRVLAFVAVGVALAISPGCGRSVDLKTLSPTDVLTGWYDDGLKDGLNHLVPSISFRLRNGGSVPANEVGLTVSFWREGEDGEWDSLEVPGIGRTAVA